MSGNKYHLLEADGYLYCIPSRDLITPDSSKVTEHQEIEFKYGSQKFKGVVLRISSKERSILAEIKELLKQKKKKENSFHEDQPRKAALKQRLMMKAINKPPSSAADLKPDKKDKNAKAEKKKFKLNAERTTTIIAGEKSNTDVPSPSSAEPVVESEIAVEVKQSNPVKVEDQELLDLPKLTDDDESSSSGASSIGCTDNTARVRGTQKALQALKQLNSSDSDDAITGPNATESSTIDLAQTNMIDSDNKNDNADGDANFKSRDDHSEILDTDLKLDEDKSGSEEVHERKRSKKSKKKSKKRKKSKKSRKGKKKHSKSHRKQLESSSDSSSSDSTESDSDSSSDSSMVKSKHRKHYDSSSSSSSDSSSRSSSDNHKRKRIKKTIVKRNVEVFDGVNYIWKEDDPGVVQLHPNYKVYVKADELNATLTSAKSCTMFIRNMVDKIYTEEAIMNCTPQGFPARSRGKKYLKKAPTKCRLHPDGREALLAKATELENERKSWRPKVGINSMKQAFSGRCSELRA